MVSDERTVEKTKNATVRKYFGTDGFRGEAGVTLTSRHAYLVGRFIGWYYSAHAKEGKRARIIVGKDTRLSGYMLEYSIIAGITASGADAYMLHVITTPGVSYITSTDGFDCGIIITASHNPYRDNGIKLINGHGEKMSEDVTSMIEAYIDGILPLPEGDGNVTAKENKLTVMGDDLPYATGERIGKIIDYSIGRSRYVGYLVSLVSCSFKDLRIGLDCANGAPWSIARSVFEALGAELYLTGCEPNGLNINCGVGSTNIKNLVTLVQKHSLDIGFAFDGDGDRCIAVSSTGEVIDGDGILYILARALKDKGALSGNRVALTVMSNAGLCEALRDMGVGYELTPVGDRFVYERMERAGLALGGESSGHVIIRKYATTGDGILTALAVTDEMLERRESLSELTRNLKIYPQLTKNLKISDRDGVMHDTAVLQVADSIRLELGEKGKLLIRKSGTEPLIRISVECEDNEKCCSYISKIVDVIRNRGYMEDEQ